LVRDRAAELREAGLSYAEIATDLGVSKSWAWHLVNSAPGLIDPEPLHACFQELHERGLTAALLKRRMGWKQSYRLTRLFSRRLQRSTALKLASALGMDPWEVGL